MIIDPKADPSTYATASDEQLRRMGASEKDIAAVRKSVADDAKAQKTPVPTSREPPA